MVEEGLRPPSHEVRLSAEAIRNFSAYQKAIRHDMYTLVNRQVINAPLQTETARYAVMKYIDIARKDTNRQASWGDLMVRELEAGNSIVIESGPAENPTERPDTVIVALESWSDLPRSMSNVDFENMMEGFYPEEPVNAPDQSNHRTRAGIRNAISEGRMVQLLSPHPRLPQNPE